MDEEERRTLRDFWEDCTPEMRRQFRGFEDFVREVEKGSPVLK